MHQSKDMYVEKKGRPEDWSVKTLPENGRKLVVVPSILTENIPSLVRTKAKQSQAKQHETFLHAKIESNRSSQIEMSCNMSLCHSRVLLFSHSDTVREGVIRVGSVHEMSRSHMQQIGGPSASAIWDALAAVTGSLKIFLRLTTCHSICFGPH